MADWSFSNLVAPLSIGASIAAGLVGVLCGAWINSRRETKRAIVEELNSLRAARSICFSMANRFLRLKSQHILPLHLEFFRDKEEVLAAQAIAQTGGTPPAVNFRADFESLAPIWLPTDMLQKLVFEMNSIGGKGLVVAVELVSAIDALSKSIEYRNELISDFQKNRPQSQRELVDRYFGLRTAQGTYDERFAANVQTLYVQIDDCIFFSHTLGGELFGHMLRRWRRYTWRYRLSTARPQPDDWSQASIRGLMPHRNKYEDWEQGFRTTESRRLRLKPFVQKWLIRNRTSADGA